MRYLDVFWMHINLNSELKYPVFIYLGFHVVVCENSNTNNCWI